METSGRTRPVEDYMKRTKFTESRIEAILKEAENGNLVADLSRKHGFSKNNFYKWKSKYSGMDASLLRRLKDLDEENQRLKWLFADLSLEHKALKDIVQKNYKA